MRFIALLLFAGIANAQDVAGTVDLSWTLQEPASSVEIYIALSPITDDSTMDASFTVSADRTAGTFAVHALDGQNIYVRAKAVNADARKSPFSNQITTPVVVTPTAPGAPTLISISAKFTK